MSDLISRSELIKHFETIQLLEDAIGLDFVAIIDEIKEQPTAYDIDRVVQELEENARRYTKKYTTPYGNNGYKDTKAISVHKAIEIVKQGRVADDVCEWKESVGFDDIYIRNPHTNMLYSDKPIMKNIYCNTCGKKIKVVE